MNDGEKRQNLSQRCIIVKGFNSDANINIIRSIFGETVNGEVCTRTAGFKPKQKEWIILFSSSKEAKNYRDERIKKTPEGILDISQCDLSCDIPDEWLQEHDHASLPRQPPNYESIYKGQQPGQSQPFYMGHPGFDQRSGQPAYDPNLGQPGFDPRAGYDPRTGQYQIPQNPGQQPYYPQQWAPYNPNSQMGKDEKQAEWQGYWHGGNPPPPGYGYPGYPYGFQGYQASPGQGGQQGQFGPEGNPLNMPSDQAQEDRTEQEQANVESVEEPEQEEEPKTYQLKVSKLPKETTEDSLQFFFENTKKSGGGDVENVEYDEETSTAIITFEEDDAVDRVLQKLPILFLKKAIEVEAIRPVVESSSGKEEEKFYECDDGSGDPEVTCIIEVRGMKSNTTEDTIMYYFESKRGGKAEVANIEFVEDKNMYLVTFEDEEAVNRVLDKSHTVDGSKLQVKKHIPPKRYPNKALVKGLSEKTSKDGLVNFLEARTKKDVENVEFSDEDAKKAIVTFVEPIDLDELQTICKKKTIDGCHLTIQPVVVSNCIIVRGFSDKTTDSALEHYFDNKKRSGVEGVTDVNMVKDEDYCLIFFEESKDAILACQRQQTVDKCKLQVNIFYECLGIPAGEEGSKFKPIPPVAIDNIKTRKMDFLQHSKQSKGDIEEQLKSIHADILWPTDKSDKKILKISCTMTKETKDWRKIAKSWKDDVRKVVDTYVASLVEEKHSTLQEAWAAVLDKLRAINIQDPDAVTVKVEKKPACEIFIIGKSAAVSQVSGKIKEIIDEVTKDLEMKKQQIQEEVPMKHHQLLILDFTKFPDKVRKMFDNMEVKIDRKRNIIAFNGITKDVNEAKLMMYETTSKTVSVQIGKKSKHFIKFLTNPKVGVLVGKKIMEKGIVGVWEIQDHSSVSMHALSDEDAVEASKILKEWVIEFDIKSDDRTQGLFNSPKLSQLIKSIESEYEQQAIYVQINVDKDKIIVLCTDEGETGIIREKIQDFFLFNMENEITIDLPPLQMKFLESQMKDDLNALENKLKKKNIAIAVKSDCIVVKGNQQGVKEAEDELGALVKKIYKTTHSMDKPGLHEHMSSHSGKQKLKQVGKEAHVVISSDSDEEEKYGGRGIRSKSTATTNDGTIFNTNWGQEVIVVKADITALDVDVVVNAANVTLTHGGGLAKVLVSKGGQSIQTECDDHIKAIKGNMSEGEVFCSGAGKLKCQAIIHAVGPSWKRGGNQEEERLYECVESAMEETEKRQLSSIAIPALCTGTFGYPANEATCVIAEAVRDHFKTCQSNSSIQRVFLCDLNDQSVSCFEKAGSKIFGNRNTAAAGNIKSYEGPRGNRFSGGCLSEVITGNIKIKIVKGELAKMKVDAVVNTTSKDLNLKNGAVSSSLLRNAGDIIQQECNQQYPDGVNCGDVAVTSGGKLRCQIICHGSLEQWKRDGSSIQVLESFILECLSTADKKGCNSIALPAMGTGQLGYPRDLVAHHMYSCIEEFSRKNRKSNISEVVLVLYDKDLQTVKAFEDEERKRQGAADTYQEIAGNPTSHHGRDAILGDDFVDDSYEGKQNYFERYVAYEDERVYSADMEDDFRPGYLRRMRTEDSLFTEKDSKYGTIKERFFIPSEQEDLHGVQRSPEQFSRPDTLNRQVLNRVNRNQRAQIANAFSQDQRRIPRLSRLNSAPMFKSPLTQPMRKAISQRSFSAWDKIKESKYQLEDQEIEQAMQLVKRGHPNIGGLQPVVVAMAEGYKKPQGPFIQIINVHGQHWVTISNIGCTVGSVKVYDSWKRSLQQDTKLAILAIVDTNSNNQIDVDVCQFQKQRNEYDCGLFAVAAMVALAYGSEPSQLIWDLRTLRSHFVDCLNQSQMTPFPLYQDASTIKSSSFLNQKKYILTVCNVCKQNFCNENQNLCKNCGVTPW